MSVPRMYARLTAGFPSVAVTAIVILCFDIFFIALIKITRKVAIALRAIKV